MVGCRTWAGLRTINAEMKAPRNTVEGLDIWQCAACMGGWRHV